MKNPLWMLLVCLSVVQANAESGVSVDASGYVPFRYLDSDQNGYVSRVEARSVTVVENAFDAADLNQDGLLDHEEYTSVRLAREAD